ncbi:AMP-binding protein [uncultured Marivirga sp.]|uniref:AMP-binding protein n=1 Tax=uncultured Marivirga sp. TaxID=1123707 RepID=UPI0030EC6EF3|tara:strand:+ start:85044 stop:86150 length:1107 start_codon:yes stop_codon:yes gene_type:complete
MPPALSRHVSIIYNKNEYHLQDFIHHFNNSKDQYLQSIIAFIVDWNSSSDHIFQSTSGSTGKPKRIKIQKSQIKSSALATLETLNLKEGDKALLCINPSFIGGKMMIARALIGGLDLHIAPISGNPLIDFIDNSIIDFFSFVPYQMERIIEESPESIKYLERSKAIILGGAPVPDNLAQKIKSHFYNTKVYSTYGMTETVSHVALKRINSAKEECFNALKGVSFSVDNRNCLIVNAPKISGQDSLLTNDVVELISLTQFNWLGRYDFVINSGGIKIHPEIIEKEIASIFSEFNISNRFFVFGLPHEKFGESLNLVLEGDVATENIPKILKSKLEAFQAPKQIFTIDEFAETENGKINRKRTIETILEQ